MKVLHNTGRENSLRQLSHIDKGTQAWTENIKFASVSSLWSLNTNDFTFILLFILPATDLWFFFPLTMYFVPMHSPHLSETSYIAS